MAYLKKEIRDQIKKDVRAICKANNIKMLVKSDLSGIRIDLISGDFLGCQEILFDNYRIKDHEKIGGFRRYDQLSGKVIILKIFQSISTFEAVKNIHRIMNETNYESYQADLYLHSA